eukprot:2441933-Prymnesium_polylepis.1
MLLGTRAAKDLSAADWFTLETTSGANVPSALLSNRSLAYLEQGDTTAAAVDAEHCCLARPAWPKGHLRLLAALERGDAEVREQLGAAERALRACPASAQIKEAKAALESKADMQAPLTQSDAEAAAQLAATHAVADSRTDPRRFVAAGDVGAALAVGAHGVAQDLEEAERYLRIGAGGGDVVSQRNLGHLLLQSDRPAEAAEAL